MKKNKINQLIESSIIRERIEYRGGGVEIDLSLFGDEFKGEKMTAYQNYLGGGMLSRIENDCTRFDWECNSKLIEIAEVLAMYYHEKTNELHDEWSATTFKQIQNRPLSAY